MSASLIINARDRLAWHQRLVSDASTVVMWGAWLKLWIPFAKAAAVVANVSALSLVAAPGGAVGGVPQWAVALVGTSGLLLAWGRVPAFRGRAPEARPAPWPDPASLTEAELAEARESAICVVHHDEDGRIVRVETRSA